MHLPVAAREIRVAAHDRGLYRSRVWTGALGIFVTAWILYGALNFTGRFNYAVGAQMFAIQAWVVFFFAAGAMQITNDAISSEKRAGTLGLLFLTHLKGHDVVLGKLVSSMALHFSAALATFPILALPTLLGGVQLIQSFQLLLSILNCMLFSASVGLFASAICANRQRSGTLAITIVLFFCGLLPLLTFTMSFKGLFPDLCFALDLISPFYAQRLSPGALLGPQKTFFYSSLAIVFMISCAFLTAASLITPHSWQIRERKPLLERLRKKFATWADQTIPSRSPLGQKILDTNAYEWLAARRKGATSDAWIFISITLAISAFLIWYFSHNNDPAVVLMMVCLPAATILLFNAKTRIGGHVCDRFCEDRENNALELILSTPMTVPKMIAGEFRALKRLFLWPTLVTIPLLFLGLYLCQGGIDRLSALFNTEVDLHIYRTRAFLIACWLSVFVIFDAIVLAWVGIWLSFRIRKIQFVRGNTMALVFAGPMGAFGTLVAILENTPLRFALRNGDFYQIGALLALFAIVGNILLIRKSRKFLLHTAHDSVSKHEFHTRDFPNPFAFLINLLRRAPQPRVLR